jgi:hypothetical protein
MGHINKLRKNLIIISLFLIIPFSVSCNNSNIGNGYLGSGISQSCAGEFAGFSTLAIENDSVLMIYYYCK